MLPIKHKGTSSELKAAVFLLDQGYEVFRNISQHGPIDLVAIKVGEPILLLDSKASPKTIRKEIQRVLNVKYIVNINGEYLIVTPPDKQSFICKNCGKECSGINSSHKKYYCSLICSKEYRRKISGNLIDGTTHTRANRCVVCGTLIFRLHFTKRPRQWCSATCRRHLVARKLKEALESA